MTPVSEKEVKNVLNSKISPRVKAKNRQNEEYNTLIINKSYFIFNSVQIIEWICERDSPLQRSK